ncbi:MAG: hypothetical protein E7414_02580 [Ruminococcaceae bacterium]|nr:hypothetical protein [Oscillospiraceae bacterium]
MDSPMFYKPKTGRRVLWALLIAAVILIVIFAANWLVTLVMGDREIKAPSTDQPGLTPIAFELDPGVSYKNAAGRSKLYFYSAENVKITDKSGELLKDLTLKLSRPEVSLSGDYAIFYDPGGRRIISFFGEKQLSELTLESNILLASVNEDGYMLIVTEGDLHKCAVLVYSPDGEEIFKWNSGGLSVIGGDISDNNRDITVSAINTDEGVIKNSIIMFNIGKEKPFTNDTYEDDLYSVIQYSGGYVYCIGTGGTHIYNGYGKCVGTAQYTDRELQGYALDGTVLALSFSGSSAAAGVAELKTYNTRGGETGSFVSNHEIEFFDCKNGSIVVNNGRTLSVLNDRCREKLQINLGFDLRDFSFIGDSRHGIGITATGAEIIELGL